VDEVQAMDLARYRRTAAWGSFVPMVVFGVGAALQSELFQVASGLAAYGEIYDVPLWARLVANMTAAILIGAAVWLVPISPGRRVWWLAAITSAAVVGVLVRGGLQVALGVYQTSRMDLVWLDVVVGLFCGLFSLAVGMVLADAFRRVRLQERSASRQALRASAALDALQAEELRVRREVAEGLHGTVQHRLVLVGAGLRGIFDELSVGGGVEQKHVRRLAELERDVDDLREHGVREIGQLLYPAGVSLGVSQAVRMMLQRIPSSIRVQAHIDESVVEYDDPAFARVPQAIRLLAVRLLEEAVSNALRHGNAGQIAVALGMDDDHVLTIIVDDDGAGIPEEVAFSGLESLRERLDDVGGALELTPGPLGGARLSATIPLDQR
jgi:two-component system sensor histidine kinase UhpB